MNICYEEKMENRVYTEAMFAIPIGKVMVDQKICDELKSLKGLNQDTNPDLYHWNVLKDYPEIKKTIKSFYTMGKWYWRFSSRLGYDYQLGYRKYKR